MTTSGISATQASTQRLGMALSLWYSAGQPLVLTLPRRRKGRDWMRTGKLGLPGQAGHPAGEFVSVGAGWGHTCGVRSNGSGASEADTGAWPDRLGLPAINRRSSPGPTPKAA